MPQSPLFAGGGDGLLPRRSKPPEADIDITPMIDCVFLLLIFFMVSSTMRGTPDLDVPVANHSTGVDSRGAVIVTIRNPLAGDPAPRLLLGDGGGPEATPAELKQYVEDAVRSGRTNLVLKAEGDVPHGVVDEVGQLIRGVTGVKLFLGVREGKEANQ
jgi:biopolymer transport protein TolR